MITKKRKNHSINITELIEFQEKIIEFLETKNLLHMQTDFSNGIALKDFPEFNSQTEIVFKELNENINTNPQFLVDIAKEFLNNRETLTKLIVSSRKWKNKDNTTILDTVEKISNLYELIPILKYPAYLLSKGKTNYNNLNNPNSILKYFNKFGLSKRCIKNLRLIRNAESHKFTIEEDKIIFQDGSSLNSFEIEKLFNKYNNIVSWWFTFLFMIFFTLPKFTLLVIISIYASLSNYKEDWKKYGKGIKYFFKDLIRYTKKDIQKKIYRPKKNYRKVITIYNKLKKYLISIFRSKEKEKRLQSNTSVIVNKLKINLNLLGDEISNISRMLNNDNDKQNLENIAIWLHNPKNILRKFIYLFENDPETYLLMIKKKVNK